MTPFGLEIDDPLLIHSWFPLFEPDLLLLLKSFGLLSLTTITFFGV